MALNFPANPVDGDVYESYVYDSATGGWRSNHPYADTLPAGAVIPWSTNIAPPNWLLCDGSAVSRTTYASLYSVIGITYGAGDGSTTFNLPDMRGRTIVGRDSSDSDFVTLGQSGGTKTHTLSLAEMPNHRHIVDWHNHSQYVTANSGGPAIRRDFTSDGSSWSYPQGQATDGSQPGTSYEGSGQPHNNLQPYEVMNYIIKTTFGTTPDSAQDYTILATYNSRLTQVEQGLELWRGNNLPVFQARLATNHSRSGGDSWAKISGLTNVEINQGNYYNSSLSRFVAPVAGIYDFSASFHTTAAAGGPAIAFVKNNTTGTVDGMIYNASYNTTTINRKIALEVGDYVEVWSRNVNSTSFTFDTGWGGLFSGQLLN